MINLLFMMNIIWAFASTPNQPSQCKGLFPKNAEVPTLHSLTDMLDERGVVYELRGEQVHISTSGLTPMNYLSTRVEALFGEPLVILQSPTVNDHPDHPYHIVYWGKLMVLLADQMNAQDIVQMILNDTKAKFRGDPPEDDLENK